MTSRPALRTATRPGLRVVAGKGTPKVRIVPWIIFTLVAVIAFFGLIASRTSLDQTAFELETLQNDISTEQARFDELRLEVARLSSPQRVAPLAEDMGMVLPQSVRRIAGTLVEPDDATLPHWAEIKPIVTAQP